MKTILVTGAAGFIGSAVSQALLSRGDVVIGVDDFNDYYNPKLKRDRIEHFCTHPRFTLYQRDIREFAVLREIFVTNHIDQICHLAARAGVRASIQMPLLYTEVNVIGTQNLLELAKEFGIEDFIFASSSSVYGKSRNVPFVETEPVDTAVSMYAATKKASEVLAYTYHHFYGMHCTGLRYFTVYGPWGRPDMSPFLFSHAIANDQPITVFNAGKLKRDFTYIDDIVDGTIAALDHHHPYEIINLGNSRSVDIPYFIALLERGLGKKAVITDAPLPPSDLPETAADITKAREKLGFTPSTPIEEGVQRFLTWFRAYYGV